MFIEYDKFLATGQLSDDYWLAMCKSTIESGAPEDGIEDAILVNSVGA